MACTPLPVRAKSVVLAPTRLMHPMAVAQLEGAAAVRAAVALGITGGFTVLAHRMRVLKSRTADGSQNHAQ